MITPALISSACHVLRPLGVVLAVLVMYGFTSQAKAQSSFTVTLEQDGSNVVATGFGTINTAELAYVDGGDREGTVMNPGNTDLDLGPPGNIDVYTGFAGPTSFGTGGYTISSSGTGDVVGMIDSMDNSTLTTWLVVPAGYVSDATLSSTASWDNQTFSSLGVNAGTYQWSWGPDGEDTFTLYAVPEPSSFRLGLAALLAFCALVPIARRAVTRDAVVAYS